MENVLINKLELASELAEIKLLENFSDTMQIYNYADPYAITYTEEAQNIFNEYYDEYLELIDSLTIK